MSLATTHSRRPTHQNAESLLGCWTLCKGWRQESTLIFTITVKHGDELLYWKNKSINTRLSLHLILNIHKTKKGGKAWHSVLISQHGIWSNCSSVKQTSTLLQPQLFPLHASLLLSLTSTITDENTKSPKKFTKLAFMRKKTSPFVWWVVFHLHITNVSLLNEIHKSILLLHSQKLPCLQAGWRLGERSSACAERAGSCPVPCLSAPRLVSVPCLPRTVRSYYEPEGNAQAHLQKILFDWVKQALYRSEFC